eukprot:132198_1
MDDAKEPTNVNTAKLLFEQKQLFCKLLLLEIEKYEQSLSQSQPAKTRVERKESRNEDWQGFQSEQEVQEFGRNYFDIILNSITTNTPIQANDAFLSEYMLDTIQYAGNGRIVSGVQNWRTMHNGFVEMCQECWLEDYKVTSWVPHSFSASYSISITFNNDKKKMTNNGNLSAVMSQDRKVLAYFIETSTHESFQDIIQLASAE